MPAQRTGSPVLHPAVPGAPASAFEMTVIGFLIVIVLYIGQAVLVPLALAVILSFVLAPPVRLLRRAGLGNSPSVVLIVAVAFAAIFGVGALITQQVASLVDELPSYQSTLREKVKSLKEVTRSSGALKQAGDALRDLQDELDKPDAPPTTTTPSVTLPAMPGDVRPADRHPVPVVVRAPSPTPLDQLQTIIGVVIHPLATAALVILFVLFLLLQSEDVRDRAIRLLGSHDLEKSTTAIDDAGERLGSYFLALTAINTAYGIVIAFALWTIGVPSPVLWGVLAALMRFVPFIGAPIAAIFPLILAAAVDPGWTMFLWTLALYVASETLMGNVIEPVVQGQRTGLSPLAIVLSAAFWTLLWGPIGLLLAIPLTVVLVVLGRHVERLEFLNVLLGDAPPLSPAQRFYQRMLAGDPAEAVEQAEKFIKERPLVDYYDEVLVEGLRLAQTDAERGTLGPSRLDDIRDTSDVVIDALADYEVGPKVRKRRPIVELDGAEEKEQDEQEAAAALRDQDEEREISEPAHMPLSDAWKQANAVLCVASRTALDETVALALASLLHQYGIGTKVIDAERLHHGTLSEEDRQGAQLICVSALDARERSAHARFLVRRLKRSSPDAVVLGGFWKLDEKADAAVIESVPVDATATTLREALRFCLDTARADSEETAAAQVETMRIESTVPPADARAAS